MALNYFIFILMWHIICAESRQRTPGLAKQEGPELN